MSTNEERLQSILSHYETLQQSVETSEDGFQREFMSLKLKSAENKEHNRYPADSGLQPYNKKKNRFKDIIPFEYTRVILPEVNGVEGSDYVNANYIKGPFSKVMYIAAQGPLQRTVNDFWRMLWHCNTEVILMACKEVEMGKHKCENYWGEMESSVMYGDISVMTTSEECLAKDFIVRDLLVERNEEQRILRQFHYSAWPDHGTPSSPEPILSMIDHVMGFRRREDIPLLVHCSAGCGRTGTILAIDYVRRLLLSKQIPEDLNLYKVVEKMRTQRPSMVQAKDQYVFVYRAVAELIKANLAKPRHQYENTAININSTSAAASSPASYENVQPKGVKASIESPQTEAIYENAPNHATGSSTSKLPMVPPRTKNPQRSDSSIADTQGSGGNNGSANTATPPPKKLKPTPPAVAIKKTSSAKPPVASPLKDAKGSFQPSSPDISRKASQLSSSVVNNNPVGSGAGVVGSNKPPAVAPRDNKSSLVPPAVAPRDTNGSSGRGPVSSSNSSSFSSSTSHQDSSAVASTATAPAAATSSPTVRTKYDNVHRHIPVPLARKKSSSSSPSPHSSTPEPSLPPPPPSSSSQPTSEPVYATVDVSKRTHDKGPEIGVVFDDNVRVPLSKVEEELDKLPPGMSPPPAATDKSPGKMSILDILQNELGDDIVPDSTSDEDQPLPPPPPPPSSSSSSSNTTKEPFYTSFEDELPPEVPRKTPASHELVSGPPLPPFPTVVTTTTEKQPSSSSSPQKKLITPKNSVSSPPLPSPPSSINKPDNVYESPVLPSLSVPMASPSTTSTSLHALVTMPRTPPTGSKHSHPSSGLSNIFKRNRSSRAHKLCDPVGVKHSMSDELISASAPSSLKLDRPRAGGVTIETGEPANEKYTFPGTMGFGIRVKKPTGPRPEPRIWPVLGMAAGR